MDSDHWISRLAAAKRFYAAQLGHGDRGMEELDMDNEEAEEGGGRAAEFACPYCYEDHDVASLCAHLEEEHPFEPHAAPCPICSHKITRDMLNHITMQHGYLFKNRRRLRKFTVPGSQSLSLLSRDLREAHLQLLLGGGGHRSSNNNATNISADPLLSSFGLSIPTPDAEETSKLPISAPSDASVLKETHVQPWQSRGTSEFIHLLLLFPLAVLTHPSRAKKGSKSGNRPVVEQHLCKTYCCLLFSGTINSRRCNIIPETGSSVMRTRKDQCLQVAGCSVSSMAGRQACSWSVFRLQ